MKCLLIGNFGVGNFGDEALKQFFLTEFTSVEWLVVSAQPNKSNEVARLPMGIRSLLALPWLKTLRMYRSCDAVVYGGGSLFTDTESVIACLLWWLHSLPARFYRKPVHLAFQGIGPFHTWLGEWLTRSVLQSAQSISVRDELSYDRAKKICKSKKIVQSIDPVISLIEKEKVNIRTQKILTLIPRKNSSEKFTEMAQKYAESMPWEEIRIVSMEPDNVMEKRYVKSLLALLGNQAACHVARTLPELLSHIAPAAQVVSERYHGALPAVFYGKPVEIVSQKKGDKLDALAAQSTIDMAALSSGIALLNQWIL